MLPCCNNVVIPINPCANSVPCTQIIDAACVQYNGTLACIAGTNPSLDVILVGFCTGITTLGAEVTTLISNEVYTTKICLTAAQVLQLFTTPVILLPAPGVGKVIQVLSVLGSINFNTRAYTTNTVLEVLQGGTEISTATVLLTQTISTLDTFGSDSGPMQPNTTVILTTRNGNPLVGDSPICIYISYKILTL